MSKRSIVAVVAVVVVAAVLYLCGHALWTMLVAMHHR
jgi:hypothetical protein